MHISTSVRLLCEFGACGTSTTYGRSVVGPTGPASSAGPATRGSCNASGLAFARPSSAMSAVTFAIDLLGFAYVRVEFRLLRFVASAMSYLPEQFH